MSNNESHWITLQSDELSARIDPLGAQLSSLRGGGASLRGGGGAELLWHGDPAVWAGRAPILFPIIGTLAGGRYRLGSKEYALTRHGFARGKTFDVITATASNAVFRLRADEATLAVFPFAFELDVSFSVKGATLSVTASARNAGHEPMPASLGFHPGLRWPLPFGGARSEHFIQFDADETAPVRRIDASGLLSPQDHPTPVVNGKLALDDALFKDDVLIFDRLRSRSLTYGAETGAQLEVGFPDATYLGLWTKPGAPFICIEPWQGVTDPAGFTGDFRDKPGSFVVAPGASHSLSMTISIRELAIRELAIQELAIREPAKR